MPKQNKTIIGILSAALMAVAFVLRMIYEDLPNAMLQSVMCLTRDSIHLFLLFMWVVSLHRRLTNKNVRRLMLLVDGSYLTGYNTDTFSFAVTAARAAKLYKCVITDVGGNVVETNYVSVTIG